MVGLSCWYSRGIFGSFNQEIRDQWRLGDLDWVRIDRDFPEEMTSHSPDYNYLALPMHLIHQMMN